MSTKIPEATSARARHGAPLRMDVQALRAFAVLAVVIYHLWPAALPGGYAGVDVFFVISGFLITAQLVRRRERGPMGLASFWAARARRLLPLSLLVLVASLVMTVAWAPDTLKNQYFASIIGSTFYVENWQLAFNAVDYLSEDNPPPIAQHYWSLSVEEQFYVIWPLLIILVTAGLAVSSARIRRRLLGAFVFVMVFSFLLNVWLTLSGSPFAYFATPGRMWEFALGGLIALLVHRRVPKVVAPLLGATGWATLALSVFLLNSQTAFPGFAALLPTVGAALVILAGADTALRPLATLTQSRLVQWLGDQSYGIYLWHWPLVIIGPAIAGGPLSDIQKLLVLGLTLALSAVSKRFVEDPIRFSPHPWLQHSRTVGAATLAAMILLAGATYLPMWQASASAQARAVQVEQELTDPDACRGANALMVESCRTILGVVTEADALAPPRQSVQDDTGGAFECYDQSPTTDVNVCTFGSDASDAVRLALNGDSHAAMLIPALRLIAERNNWSVDTFVGRGCAWSDEVDPECAPRRAAVEQQLLRGEYDAILQTAWNIRSRSDAQRRAVADDYASAWERAAKNGVQVIPIIDNPGVPEDAAQCFATVDRFAFDTCAFDDPGTSADPLRLAADRARIEPVDLSAAYCLDRACPMVLGSVAVYRDLHHITATFSRSLAPHLEARISERLSSGDLGVEQ